MWALSTLHQNLYVALSLGLVHKDCNGVVMVNLKGTGERAPKLPGGALLPDPQTFRCFLESLSPDQMSLLILSGALDNKIRNDEVVVSDYDAFIPAATNREKLDFDAWKNRADPKIR